MEPEVGNWIIEFLARQPVDDRILNKLVSILPLSVDDFRLKKTLLIRSIQTEFLSGAVSERLLNLLELVVELDFREGKVASESLKEAYCAVAVDCTVRFLDDDLEDDCKYFDTLKRIWRVRIPAMEKSENSGLVSEKLLKWKDDLEAAVWDVELRGKIILMNTRNEALGRVEGYLEEAWNDLGPSYIEKSAQDFINLRDNGERVEDVELAEIVGNASDGDYPMPTELVDVSGDETSENQVFKVVENVFVPNDGMIGEGVEGARLSETLENADLLDDSMDVGNGSGIDGDRARPRDLREESMDVTSENQVFGVEDAFVRNDGMISGGRSAVDGENSKEKDRIGNDSSVEMPQRDKNLSETQGTAGMPISEINIGDNPAGNQGGEQSFSPLGTSAGVRSETGKGVQVRYKLSALRSRVKGHRRSAPAKIADNEEMDEHIPEVSRVQEELESGNKQPLPDTLRMEKANSTGVEAQDVHTPVESPSARPDNAPANNADGVLKKDSTGEQSTGRDDVNPSDAAANRRLEMGEASPGASVNKTVKKTKRRFWTPLEEDMLRTGVKKFGKGSWKLILYAHSDVFQGRTEVDLKDKWRNMVK